MKPGDLVRIVDNDTFTFNLHANKPGLYLGKTRAGMYSVLVDTGKIFFPTPAECFEKVD